MRTYLKITNQLDGKIDINANDGTYSFYANYYNGGTCLEECLDDEFAKIL